MTGPSIVVPPAMPHRSMSLVAHSNAARNPHQGVTTLKKPNATVPTAAKTMGRKEHIGGKRVCCSVSSCPNVLDPGWPWKRCKQCSKGAKAREMRRATIPLDLACASCFAVSTAVPVNDLKAGQLYLCRPCHERGAAFSTQPPALHSKHPPAPPRHIVMQDASLMPQHDASTLGHGPPSVSQVLYSNPSTYLHTLSPPPRAQFLPMSVAPDVTSVTSILDEVAQFVHRDHRHILGLRDVLVSPAPSQIGPAPALASEPMIMSDTPPQEPAVKRVRLTMPHYSPTGAILAVLPEDLGMNRSTLPSAKALPRAEKSFNATDVEKVAGSSSAPVARTDPYPLEAPRKVSVTHTQGGSIKLKIPPKPISPSTAGPIQTPSDKPPNAPSSKNAAPSSSSIPTPPSTKRKRAARPSNRICALPGCENVILPRFKGSRCVQCGFAQWSTVFRERFDGIRAELIQAGMAGAATAVKEDPGLKEEIPFVKKQPAAEERKSSAESMEVNASHVTTPNLEREPSTAQDGMGVSSSASTVSRSGSHPPRLSRKPSIKSVKLIVSPPHTTPTFDPSSSSSRMETTRSEAVDVLRPKIKSIKRRVSVHPDSHTTSTDILATNIDGTAQLITAPLIAMDAVEAEDKYPMDIDHDREASDGDTTDSEASIPLARCSAAADTKNTPQLAVPDAAEADGEYPMYIDHGLEDHTGDTTDSEASIPLLARVSPSHIPSPAPFSSASLPPIRRVRLILGPDPSRAPSSSRESSPELTLSSTRPFSARRRWVELGWDTDESDLTPLEDSTDEGESEVNLPESDDEDDGVDGAGTRPSIVIPRRTEKPPKKHRWQCATVRCANLLPHGSFFKNCDACRKRSHLLRKQEMKRDQLEGTATSKYDDVELQIPPDADLTGYRRCSHNRCNHLIPPESQYRFRTCGPCRAHRRKGWWKRKGLEAPDCDAILHKSASASIMEHAIANAVRTAAKEDTAPVTGKRKRRAVDDAREAGADGEKLMEMPPYQHLAALLDSMRSRFSQFKAVQMRYVQLKALTGTDSKPMVFNFDGEYSVIADPSGGSVDAVVNTVVRNIQSVLELRFQLSGVYSGPEDSAIASLSGAYVAKIPQLSTKEPVATTTGSDTVIPTEASAYADSAADVPLEVTMAGELHICVAWDRRHKFFPGQRIMVRFRLVG